MMLKALVTIYALEEVRRTVVETMVRRNVVRAGAIAALMVVVITRVLLTVAVVAIRLFPAGPCHPRRQVRARFHDLEPWRKNARRCQGEKPDHEGGSTKELKHESLQ